MIEEKNVNKVIIFEKIKKAWDYLIFFTSLDSNKKYSSVEKMNIIQVVTERKELSNLEFLHDDSVFTCFIKKMGPNYSDNIEILSGILEIPYEDLIKYFDHGISSNREFDTTIILLLLHIPLIIGAKISKRNQLVRRILFFIYASGMIIFILLLLLNL